MCTRRGRCARRRQDLSLDDVLPSLSWHSRGRLDAATRHERMPFGQECLPGDAHHAICHESWHLQAVVRSAVYSEWMQNGNVACISSNLLDA